jgi:hypothetical protein
MTISAKYANPAGVVGDAASYALNSFRKFSECAMLQL